MPQVVAWAASAFASVVSGVTAAASAVTGALGIGGSAALATHATVSSAAIATATNSISLASVLNGINTALSVASLFVKPKAPATNGGSVEFRADPNAGLPIILGRCATGGKVVHANTYGDVAQYLSYHAVLSAAGPIEAIDEFRSNNKVHTFDSGTWASTDAFFSNTMWQGQKLGAQPETAWSAPSPFGALATDITSAHKASGHAMAWWIMKFAAARYSSGVPKPLWVLRGIKVYDPRYDSTYPGGSGTQRLATRSTWAYSDNPHIHALNFLLGYTHNTTRIGGCGVPLAEIDVAAFIEGANICDANGWSLGGEINTDNGKWATLASILQAGSSTPMVKGAYISCFTNSAKTSVATINQEDLMGPWSVETSLAYRDRKNYIIPKYRSEDHGWLYVPADGVTSSTYQTQDGGKRSTEVTYEMVTDVDQAAQLARYDLENMRERLVAALPIKPQYMGIKAGDAITLNLAEAGITGQKMIVLKKVFSPGSFAVNLICRSETDAKHTAVSSTTGTAAYDPGYTYDELDLTAPSAATWDVVGTTIAGTNSTTVPAIVATLGSGQSHRANAVNLLFEYKKAADSVWIVGYAGPIVDRVEILALAQGTSYDVRVSYGYSEAGAFTDPRVEGPVTTGTIIANEVYNQGDLATLDDVDTPQIVPGAVTSSDVQIRTSGYGGVGLINIPYSVTAPSSAGYTKVDSYTFSYTGDGYILIEWHGVLQWNANAARSTNMFLCLDQTPYLLTGGVVDSQYDAMQTYKGNGNSQSSTVILSKAFTGLSVGSHTIDIYGRGTTSGSNQPDLDINAATKKWVLKV